MPSRPSKKVRTATGAKPGAVPGAADNDRASQQRRRDLTTKAILGKFQGRKSI